MPNRALYYIDKFLSLFDISGLVMTKPKETGTKTEPPYEIGAHEINPYQIGPYEIGPYEIGPSYQIGPSKKSPCEIDPLLKN